MYPPATVGPGSHVNVSMLMQKVLLIAVPSEPVMTWFIVTKHTMRFASSSQQAIIPISVDVGSLVLGGALHEGGVPLRVTCCQVLSHAPDELPIAMVHNCMLSANVQNKRLRRLKPPRR